MFQGNFQITSPFPLSACSGGEPVLLFSPSVPSRGVVRRFCQGPAAPLSAGPSVVGLLVVPAADPLVALPLVVLDFPILIML